MNNSERELRNKSLPNSSMTITRKTTFLHGKALMPEPSDSREKKKVLALLCGAGYSKKFPFCVF